MNKIQTKPNNYPLFLYDQRKMKGGSGLNFENMVTFIADMHIIHILILEQKLL